jgi:hypothetical protein
MINEYPIPRVEHIFNKMRGAKILPLGHHGRIHAPRSRRAHAMTLNTPIHSLIRPTRVVYGAANIPAIWQRRMEVLRDLANVVNFFGDTIVFADTLDNLLQALSTVLERLRRHGLKLNRAKCKFGETTLQCLGHKLL